MKSSPNRSDDHFATSSIVAMTSSTGASSPANSKHKQSNSNFSFGHDRQPSVQLKIEASGGPPFPRAAKSSSFAARTGRNLNYFFSQLFALLSRLSPIVQSISALLILVYLIQFSGDVVIDFFALTPGEIISPGQWYHTVISLWSHVFLETRIYSLIVDLLILSFCSTLIEPLWGAKEVLRFIVIACIPSALLTAIHFILLYYATYDVGYLFSVRIHGFLPFCAAVVVTVKQLLPESVLFATSFGRFKNDHIPFTVFVSLVLLYAFNILRGVQVIMFTYGIMSSWIYLRFLQPHTRHSISTIRLSSTGKFLNSGISPSSSLSSSSSTLSLTSAPNTGTTTATKTITRGDLSDSFAFETFFPSILLRPAIAIIANFVYATLVRAHICPKIPSPAARLLDEQQNNPSSLLHHHYQYNHSHHHHHQPQPQQHQQHQQQQQQKSAIPKSNFSNNSMYYYNNQAATTAASPQTIGRSSDSLVQPLLSSSSSSTTGVENL